MEMCAGALIPSRTLSRPIRRTWISISFPMMSFSSFFRVTTSIEILLASILEGDLIVHGLQDDCAKAYRKAGDRARGHSTGLSPKSRISWLRPGGNLQKLAHGETGICENNLSSGHGFLVDQQRSLKVSSARHES